MSHWGRRSYQNWRFKELVRDGELRPKKLPSRLHLHWVLVRGHPRWVTALRKSDACGTIRCREVIILSVPETDYEESEAQAQKVLLKTLWPSQLRRSMGG